MPPEISFYLNINSGNCMNILPLNLLTKCLEIAVKFALTFDKCKFSTHKKANILANYLLFKMEHHIEFDCEVFLEYLKINKKANYNLEMRTKHETESDISGEIGFNVFNAKGINKNDLSGQISLYSGKWMMYYDHDTDFKLIEMFLIHLIENENVLWNELITIHSLRFKQKWLQQWINTNKGKTMVESFNQFVDVKYLKLLQLVVLLRRGKNIKNTTQYMNELKQLIEYTPPNTRYASQDIIYKLENEIIFDFDPNKNKETFSLQDNEINLYLNVKNLFNDSKDILISIFEMNTLSYYRNQLKEFDVTINLDGLHSKYSYSIPTTTDQQQVNKYQIKQYVIKFPVELLHKRGVYIIDCILNGIQARTLIKIGDIKFIETVTITGHCFTFFDEKNALITPKETRCNIWMNGHIYKSKLENNNHVYIPFTTNNENKLNQPIIIQREDDPNFNVLSHFNHSQEKYLFDCNIFIDREQLLEKQKAIVLIRSCLYIQSSVDNNIKRKISVKSLQNTQLQINISTGTDVDVDESFNVQLKDEQETAISFIVPTKTRKINLKLSAFVRLIHSIKVGNEGMQFVAFDKTFIINDVDDTNKFGAFHLNKCENGDYIISLLGKNGEYIPNIVCNVNLYHTYFQKPLKHTLKTDQNGQIYLPKLNKYNNNNGFETIFISAKHHNTQNIIASNKWNLTFDYSCDNDIYYMNENSSLNIALYHHVETSGADYSLFDGIYSATYENCITFTLNGYLNVKNLKHGQYIFSSFNCNIPSLTFVVLPNNNLQSNKSQSTEIKPNKYRLTPQLSLYREYYMQLSSPETLQISQIIGSFDKGFRIKINGVNKLTRVHIVFTHFYPKINILKHLKKLSASTLITGVFNTSKNKLTFCNKRRIHDEYRYCIDRQKRNKTNGNFFDKSIFFNQTIQKK
eukprot:367673_1